MWTIDASCPSCSSRSGTGEPVIECGLLVGVLVECQCGALSVITPSGEE